MSSRLPRDFKNRKDALAFCKDYECSCEGPAPVRCAIVPSEIQCVNTIRRCIIQKYNILLLILWVCMLLVIYDLNHDGDRPQEAVGTGGAHVRMSEPHG
jgi:hypothetical protein